ncbi:TOBE domain-containing protein [Streptomyces sp. L06]|nr:TOBE domain-containing protein [Streptomyces sp. L06]
MDRARLQDCGTPEELYRRPRTEFTASFVGNANLLPVRVGVREGTVDLAGHTLSVATGGAARGSAATLCLRPHLVGLGEGPNALRGTLADLQWRGSTHRLRVDVDGQAVLADLRELRDPPALGSPVTLHFAAEDAVLLPAAAPVAAAAPGGAGV